MKLCFIGDAGHVNLLSWIRFYAVRLGHEVHVVTFNPPCEPVDGVRFHCVQGPLMRGKFRYVLAIPAIRRLIRTVKPDLVVGYRINSYGLLAVASGFRPLVLVAQGNDLWEPTLQTAVSRYTARRADLLQTWAPHMTRKLIELGGPPDRILTLPKGIDTETFRAGDVPAHEPVVISTRQFRPEYRHELILQAVAIARARVPSMKYVVCGDGPCRADLQRMVEDLGLSLTVEFRGRVAHAKLPIQLQNAQVYVSVIGEDGVSASLLEAMACGAFPIVPDVEPNRDWIRDGVNGFLVPPGDTKRLADRIVIALSSPELRTAARTHNVNAIAARASMAANMAQMERHYLGLVAQGMRAYA
jgi:glycosyltransferase involved in cell wall biosynthesis